MMCYPRVQLVILAASVLHEFATKTIADLKEKLTCRISKASRLCQLHFDSTTLCKGHCSALTCCSCSEHNDWQMIGNVPRKLDVRKYAKTDQSSYANSVHLSCGKVLTSDVWGNQLRGQEKDNDKKEAEWKKQREKAKNANQKRDQQAQLKKEKEEGQSEDWERRQRAFVSGSQDGTSSKRMPARGREENINDRFWAQENRVREGRDNDGEERDRRRGRRKGDEESDEELGKRSRLIREQREKKRTKNWDFENNRWLDPDENDGSVPWR
eukprot:gnl/MRDRNA2_/MRDRNA2_33098_c0_seq1.p1 gnl/MRDRNA2_/MRDRNA2_33098_c0~~gnl/MRDRNA2_/MRDRNA2_33098_c0_seq1.p1  ORF type:complete len:269 (+),score=47.22 gnl/MRDRNA2_/MRDRNA2_33098_c0_seq1:67-873(+)